jgi:hypothetical protein
MPTPIIPLFNAGAFGWHNPERVATRSFVCGFCSHRVGSDKGYTVIHLGGKQPQRFGIFICPTCQGPTFLDQNEYQVPAPAIGSSVKDVPEKLNELYEEARRCTTTSCFTAAVLICRKMLMNIAVSQGANEGLKFIEYVNFLADNHFIPPNGKHWVDHIRMKGNEATHEIALMKEADAKDLLNFLEMLLRFIYEFPARIRPVATPKTPGG